MQTFAGIDSTEASSLQSRIQCALSSVTGLASGDFTFTNTQNVVLLATGVQVDVNVQFQAQALGYPSSSAAQNSVTNKLTAANSATSVKNDLSDTGVTAVTITVNSQGSTTANAAGTATAGSSGTSFDIALVVGLIVAFAICLLLVATWYYCHYRRNKQLQKLENVRNSKAINFNDVSGVIPDESDAVEWGLNVSGEDLGAAQGAAQGLDRGDSTASNASAASPRMRTRYSPAKQRKADLFVI